MKMQRFPIYLQSHIVSSIINISHKSSTFVRNDEPTIDTLLSSKSTVYIRGQSWHCKFDRLGKMYNDTYLSFWASQVAQWYFLVTSKLWQFFVQDAAFLFLMIKVCLVLQENTSKVAVALHSYQQWMRILVAPHLHQHLMLSCSRFWLFL